MTTKRFIVYTYSRSSEIKFVLLFFHTLPEFNIQIVFPKRYVYAFWYHHGQIEIRTILYDITERSIYELLWLAAFFVRDIYTNVSADRWTSITYDLNDIDK